jgi:hypothetical protein
MVQQRKQFRRPRWHGIGSSQTPLREAVLHPSAPDRIPEGETSSAHWSADDFFLGREFCGGLHHDGNEYAGAVVNENLAGLSDGCHDNDPSGLGPGIKWENLAWGIRGPWIPPESTDRTMSW